MGDFDDEIENLKKMRDDFVDDLKFWSLDNKIFRNGEDKTSEYKKRIKGNIDLIDILIAAYESHNQ